MIRSNKMSKYIVKNCPSYDKDEQKGYTCTTLSVKSAECEDCTDCLIKKVIEKCKNIDCPCEDKGTACLVCGEDSRKILANEILQLFEIEEVE